MAAHQQSDKPYHGATRESVRRVMQTQTDPIRRRRPGSTAVILGSLEFIVGAIFVFGGIALLYFTTGFYFGKITLDLILGGIHTSLGLAAFPVGVGLLMGRTWGRSSALGLNLVAIVFSVMAEIILYADSSLALNAFYDSVAGTIAGVVVALIVIFYLTRG